MLKNINSTELTERLNQIADHYDLYATEMNALHKAVEIVENIKEYFSAMNEPNLFDGFDNGEIAQWFKGKENIMKILGG